MVNQLAQKIVINGQEFYGPLPTLTPKFPGDTSNAGKFEFDSLASIVNKAVTYLFPIAGIFLFLYLVWGGFDFLTSMGDPKKAETGKNKIISALIGFLLIFAAYWIVQLLTRVFNITTSYSSPKKTGEDAPGITLIVPNFASSSMVNTET